MNLLWPKPKDKKDKKEKPAWIKVFPDGREVLNLLTKAGRDEYMQRIDRMWLRQGGICCLHGLVKDCPGRMRRREATFDHDEGRGMGGGRQDDRIEVLDETTGEMRPQNGAAHPECNALKGSVRRSRLLEMWNVP